MPLRPAIFVGALLLGSTIACGDATLGPTRQEGRFDAGPEAGAGEGGPDDGAPASDTGDGSADDAALPGLVDGGRLADGGPALPRGTGATSISTGGGLTRTLLLHVPPTWDPGDPALIALHGNSETAQEFLERWDALERVANTDGVALVLPDSLSAQGLDWDADTRPPDNNMDIQLVFAIRQYLVDRGADASRIYLLGRNRGGQLAYHAGMAGSTLFAALNVTGAADPLGSGLAATAARPIPVYMLVGGEDPVLAAAEATRDELQANDFEVIFDEVGGVGVCCPLQMQMTEVWRWMSMHTLSTSTPVGDGGVDGGVDGG